MPDVLPIPVSAPKGIAERFGKSIVVVLAYDAKFGRHESASFGVTAEDKKIAAEAEDALSRVFCLSDGHAFEAFRGGSQAEWAVERDRLMARIAELEGRSSPKIADHFASEDAFIKHCLDNAGGIYVRVGSRDVALCTMALPDRMTWIDRWWKARVESATAPPLPNE